ncbi:phage tail assembly chaperone, partial [Xenorhabdus bovienii]|uniref:phage tail assembly chaperone n=2 Tax=Xenorhabdus bovienii TaxID=40576 RepID=UPI0023B299BC
ALLPIVPALRPIWDNLKPSGVDENGKPIFSLDNMADIITPLAEAVRTLGKESRYEINDICLSVVSREAGGAWTVIYSGQQLMFDDINGLDLLKVVGHVIKDSLSNFFPALPENDGLSPVNPA